MTRYRVTVELWTAAEFQEVVEEGRAVLEKAGKENPRFPFWELVGLMKIEGFEGVEGG